MRHLSVFARLAAFVGILFAIFGALSAGQIWSLRQTIIREREEKVRDMAGSVARLAARFDEEVKAGRLGLEEAQDAAKRAIRAMRWGDGDYYGVYRYDGLTLVHGNAKNEGLFRLDVKDPSGKLLVKDVIDTARRGGGFTEYDAPRASGGPAQRKVAYAAQYEPWQWAFQAGVYIDDVDAVMLRQALWIGGVAAGGLLLAVGIAVLIGRGITRPIAGLCGTMDRLASGDHSVAIPFVERRNEVGRIARAVEVFKAGMLDAERLRAEQEVAKAKAAAEQKAAIARVADAFESRVGGIVGTVAAASTEMEHTARSVSAVAGEATRAATTVSAASTQASANVQTVAAASEELSASITEIGQQVTRSAQICEKAVSEARQTNETVESLSRSAQKIGDVVTLIQDIAAQTNLLALNATIEAARAGEAGRGFAVVASEVKSLANQTATATEEIAAQIQAIQGTTTQAVEVIRRIGGTISEINEIATTIAAAVEEQGAATLEIARNVQQAAHGTNEVSANIAGMTQASGEVGRSAGEVLAAAGELSKQSELLHREVDSFLSTIRAA
jgi:methyl-accepting chemotaxis protein